jgi:hypothetical protein
VTYSYAYFCAILLDAGKAEFHSLNSINLTLSLGTECSWKPKRKEALLRTNTFNNSNMFSLGIGVSQQALFFKA